MEIGEICAALARLEQENNVNGLELDGIELWPMVRYCLWAELMKVPAASGSGRGQFSQLRRVYDGLAALSRSVRRFEPGVTSAFFSRPVYLQHLSGPGKFFDRIADPLLFLAQHRERAAKCYLADSGAELLFPGLLLRSIPFRGAPSCESVLPEIGRLFECVALDPEAGKVAFRQTWKSFYRWYMAASGLFEASPALRRVFVVCWYSPDMMGIVAAARARGILSVDVQHGKQGRHQAMYSGWSKIPDTGYRVMPDYFWCWGKASCDHILESTPERSVHTPFIGGFPWPDYYRRFIASPPSVPATASKRILFTMQAQVGEHRTPIPDFIVDYLSSDQAKDVRVVFRCHPNFLDCSDYAADRLRGVPAERFEISDAREILYDQMIGATHHVTAFSSCCYEAEMLGVPTMLFGRDAKNIYADEISAGRFSWTGGSVNEFADWLEISQEKGQGGSPYFESSLDLASEALVSVSGIRPPNSSKAGDRRV